MRRRGKIDANQAEIVAALRKLGYSVLSLADIGNGCPDLVVGKDGKNWMLEIKDGNLPPSRKRLTKDEEEFHANWRGHIAIAETLKEALEAMR